MKQCKIRIAEKSKRTFFCKIIPKRPFYDRIKHHRRAFYYVAKQKKPVHRVEITETEMDDHPGGEKSKEHNKTKNYLK